MKWCSDQVQQYVADLVVPESLQLTQSQIAEQDEKDALLVIQNLETHQERLSPIVEQLRKFTEKNFIIEFERHYRRGLAKPNGSISIDFATLGKSEGELALTVAHEWGHLCLGHLTSTIKEHDAECQADYWAGIFLGYFGYGLDEVIKIKLSMPQVDTEHGTQFHRACLIAQGYREGQHMRLENLHAGVWPGLEVFRSQFHVAPWHINGVKKPQFVNQDNKARKLSK